MRRQLYIVLTLAIALSGCQGGNPPVQKASSQENGGQENGGKGETNQEVQSQEEQSKEGQSKEGLETAHTNYEHLKEVEWLIGNWVDRDENYQITFNCRWDTHKNFLIQQFTSDVQGQDSLNGYQLIAWDPVKQQIRSWVFDSDGGFGEGYWTNQGASWYARMRYTLPDGREGTATNIYTKIDQNTYTFSSRERDIDGELLPDIEPVKVVKATTKEGEKS